MRICSGVDGSWYKGVQLKGQIGCKGDTQCIEVVVSNIFQEALQAVTPNSMDHLRLSLKPKPIASCNIVPGWECWTLQSWLVRPDWHLCHMEKTRTLPCYHSLAVILFWLMSAYRCQSNFNLTIWLTHTATLNSWNHSESYLLLFIITWRIRWD